MLGTSYYYRVFIYVPAKHHSILIGEYKIYEHAKMRATFAARVGKRFDSNCYSKLQTLHFGDTVFVEYFERG